MAGSLKPVGFGLGGEPPNLLNRSAYEENMVYREEQDYAPWSTYAWDSWGHPTITALYCPWQILYADDVAERSNENMPLELLLGPREKLNEDLETVRGLLEGLHSSWIALDDGWRPLMKLLVRLQNRYLPAVTGRSTLVWDPDNKIQVEPWELECSSFRAADVAQELGVESAELLDAYWFLVERGIDREPRDDMEILRRARPRSASRSWRGPVLRAHDNYQAADLLRRFITDLTGEAPGRPPNWPLDGRQPFRGALFDQGPVPTLTKGQRREQLIATALYPHAVHVIGEGKSEQEFVTTIITEVIGSALAADIGFSDLGGSGSASRLPTMVEGFSEYAPCTVVIVDSEGDMIEYVTGLERSGKLAAENTLRFASNIEDSNFTPNELIAVLYDLASNPPEGRPAVSLTITPEQLEEAFDTRQVRAKEDPGKAGILLKLAEDPAYGGPVRISKPEFAAALAVRMLDDLEAVRGNDEARADLYSRRPLLPFVLERVAEPLLNRGIV